MDKAFAGDDNAPNLSEWRRLMRGLILFSVSLVSLVFCLACENECAVQVELLAACEQERQALQVELGSTIEKLQQAGLCEDLRTAVVQLTAKADELPAALEQLQTCQEEKESIKQNKAFSSLPILELPIGKQRQENLKRQQTEIDHEMEQIDQLANPSVLYVLEPKGAVILESADLDANELGKIPYGEKVTILQRAGQMKSSVGAISDGFIVGEHNGVKGFIFGGFLSRLPALESGQSLEDYLALISGDPTGKIELNSRQKGAKPFFARYQFDNFETASFSIHSTGAATFRAKGKKCSGEGAIIPALSLNEAFLLLRLVESKGNTSLAGLLPIENTETTDDPLGIEKKSKSNPVTYTYTFDENQIVFASKKNGSVSRRFVMMQDGAILLATEVCR
jgi:hypothetical protein